MERTASKSSIRCALSCGAVMAILPISSVQAGAWIEPEGQGFLASAARLRQDGYELSGYASYGMTPKLTLGLDLNSSRDAGRDTAHALIFARVPLRQGADGWQLAAELSLGMAFAENWWQPMQRLSLSAGRGFTATERSGWIAIDLAREKLPRSQAQAWKLDTTLGLNPRRGRGWAPLLQTEIYKPDRGETVWKLLPALRVEITDTHSLLAGLEWRSFGREQLGLRLALWHRF